MDPIFTESQLKNIIPAAKDKHITWYLSALNQELDKYEINSPLRKAHFIAQIAHESGSLRYKVENLNYSKEALKLVFGKYFKIEGMVDDYERNPEKIANLVYANRMGNGNTDSGDGWKYRGRGLIQLTGRSNYVDCGKFIEKDLIAQPNLVSEDPSVAVAAACWYWDSRKLNSYADKDDVKTITKKINGGHNGIEERKEFLNNAKNELCK